MTNKDMIIKNLNKSEKLEKENLELKQAKENYDKCILELYKDYKKFKKVIKGLNECFNFKIDNKTKTLYCCLGNIANIDIEFLKLLEEIMIFYI